MDSEMALSTENSIVSKNPKTRTAKTPKPPDKQYTQNISTSPQNGPLTITLPPIRNSAKPSRHPQDPLKTPTKVSGVKRPRVGITPTSQRIRRHAQGQQEPITLAPINYFQNTEYNPAIGQQYDQPMEEEDTQSENLSEIYEAPEFQFDDPPHEHLLINFRSLLDDLQDSARALKKAGILEDAVKDATNAQILAQLAEILPIMPINNHLMPLLTGIGELCQKVESLTDTLERKDNASHNSLQDSIHAPRPQPTQGPATGPTTTNRPTPNTARNNKNTTPTTQQPIAVTNPRLAHHHTRIVAQILPNGVPENIRWDPSEIVNRINGSLGSTRESKHLKIVAASYNKQGNIILSTKADQTAAELLKHEDTLREVLTRLSGKANREVILREDKKWYKIQIDGVSTGSLTVGDGRVTHTPEKIHDELLTCNPQYAALTKFIVAKPRWLRTNEEIQTTLRSSLVFALDEEQNAKNLLGLRSLAAFGRHCSLRAFQERPPVQQCRRCWSLDHSTPRCNEDQRCRLCGGPHEETHHHEAHPEKCQRCATAQENGDSMDTSAEGNCTHILRCVNCNKDDNSDCSHPADSRRCPIRLERYGTARDNERHAAKNHNPWIKAKTKAPAKKKKAASITPSEKPGNTTKNRYEALPVDATDHTAQQINDAPNRLTNTNNTQTWN